MGNVVERRGAAAKITIAAMALIGLTVLSGCKVMTIAEDHALREQHSSDFNADHYVATIWNVRALPTLDRETVDLPGLLHQAGADLGSAGRDHGRRTGEGAPWTFVARGSGTITAIDRTSRHGEITVMLDGAPADQPAQVQIGPFVQQTAIRDALPFVVFNDFADQLAFADVGSALTKRAMAGVTPSVDGLRPGDRITFAGAFNLRSAGDPIVLTPFRIGRAGAGAR